MLLEAELPWTARVALKSSQVEILILPPFRFFCEGGDSEAGPLRGGLLDEGAGDVADGDVGFLDALGVAGGYVQEQVDFGG